MSEAFFPHTYMARYPRSGDPASAMDSVEHPPHRGDCREYEESKRTGADSSAATTAPICQYCLADPRYTPISPSKHHRCPVCGASYGGPRRDREFRALVEAGLVASSD